MFNPGTTYRHDKFVDVYFKVICVAPSSDGTELIVNWYNKNNHAVVIVHYDEIFVRSSDYQRYTVV